MGCVTVFIASGGYPCTIGLLSAARALTQPSRHPGNKITPAWVAAIPGLSAMSYRTPRKELRLHAYFPGHPQRVLCDAILSYRGQGVKAPARLREGAASAASGGGIKTARSYPAPQAQTGAARRAPDGKRPSGAAAGRQAGKGPPARDRAPGRGAQPGERGDRGAGRPSGASRPGAETQSSARAGRRQERSGREHRTTAHRPASERSERAASSVPNCYLYFAWLALI